MDEDVKDEIIIEMGHLIRMLMEYGNQVIIGSFQNQLHAGYTCT